MYNANLESFVKEINKFSTTKFILYENKLSKFLTSLSSNQMMYNLIEHCLKDFDFEIEFKRAMNCGRVSLPNKAEKLIALVFCILVEIDNKKLDFYKFLKTYFQSDEINFSFAKFVEEMVVPFKNTAVALCSGDPLETPKAEEVVKEMELPIGDFALEMLNKLRNFAFTLKKCEMALPIFEAMNWAMENNNKELFQSLSYSLIFITKNRKFSRIAKLVYSQNYGKQSEQD